MDLRIATPDTTNIRGAFPASFRRFRRWVGEWQGVAFVAPAILVLGIVVLFPVSEALWLSLTSGQGAGGSTFVGLGNYQRLLADPAFWSAFRNSMVFTVSGVLGHLLLGLGTALLLNQRIRWRTPLRVVSLVPWMFSAVVVAITWRWMLDAHFGVINVILARVGFPGPYLWFEQPTLAMVALVVTNIWRGFPFASVTLLAALQAIPREQYEAAAVDGASALHQFRYVTLPNLQFAISIVATLDTIWNFKHFDLVQVMTQGGPAGATEMLTTLIYRASFENFEFGYAAAIGVVMSIFMVAATIIYVRRII
jgi:multiple sugar transport system permease protein